MADYTLSVKVTADAGQFNDAMEQVKDKTEKAASATDVFKGAFLANLASSAVISGLGAVKDAIGGIVDGVKTLVMAGVNGQAELEQNLGGSEAVFAEYADRVREKAKTAYKDMGTSTSDYLATANKIGALFQGSGLSVERSMDLSTKAMQRAADMASVMGIDTAAALEAVTGAAKGNYTIPMSLAAQ